jgi:hypothetical protein
VASADDGRWTAADIMVRPGIGRVPAQRLARQELAKSIYHESFLARIWNDIANWLNQAGSGSLPHGLWTLVALVLALILVVTVVLWWLGPMRRSRRVKSGGVLAGTQLTAAEHRANAERLAASGEYAGAIIERVRAIAVELESRGVLAPRPGRTASELAAEVSAALPGSGVELREAARLFDDVRYGDRPGTAAGYERVRELDGQIQATRTASVAVEG